MPALRYVEENGSAAMLATKNSAGVAPEVDLRGCVTDAQIRLPRGDITRIPKQGYHWSHKKTKENKKKKKK